MKFRWLAIFLPILLGGCVGWEIPFSREASQAARIDSDWFQVETAHFDVASSGGKRRAIELALELEAFRAVVFEILEVPPTTLPIPVRVHSFARAREVRGAQGPGPLAEFPPSMREYQFGVIGASKGLAPLEFALHQYVHLLLYSDFELDYPLWLQEGLATYLSTARQQGDRFEFAGLPDGLRLKDLDLEAFPLERLLRVEHYGELGQAELSYFTLVSTSLVRYLLTLNEKGGFSHPDFVAYRKRVEAGHPHAQAFEAVFGQSPQRAGENIRELIQSQRWPRTEIPLARLVVEPKRRPARRLDAAEVHTRLASFALYRYDLASATEHVSAALELDPKQARALVYRGALAQLEEEWDAAESSFERALALEPANALHWLDWAEYLQARAEREDGKIARATLFERARKAYKKSLAFEPGNPETLAKLGETYLEPDQNPRIANSFLEKAYTLHPASWKILQRLARARIALDREAEARRLLWQSSERLHLRWTEAKIDEVVRSLAAR